MKIIRTVRAMQEISDGWRREGRTVGFVPTMGYLHDGHLSLVRIARRNADRVVVSIFVNPTQFGPNEDFERYPRDFQRDERLCREEGVHAVFYPDASEMYPDDFSTWVIEESLSKTLCGRSRPGHFRGVCTVVTKLFHAVNPHVTVFGQKDGQQALVIQRMVRDLNFPIRVLVGPIVREADGLAMSSRNQYLSEDERRRAPALYRGLRKAEEAWKAGEKRASVLCGLVAREITESGGRIDYVEAVARNDLQPLETLDRPGMIAVAAWYGSTRLIDNVWLG